jgi:hypothetical protein
MVTVDGESVAFEATVADPVCAPLGVATGGAKVAVNWQVSPGVPWVPSVHPSEDAATRVNIVLVDWVTAGVARVAVSFPASVT